MKDRKSLVTLAFIGVLVILSVMIAATYAYFTINVIGDGNKIDLGMFDENMEVTFTDTSNITLSNAYTGDSITKNFSVENTGETTLFYNIVFSNLLNNFANPEDLVYELTSTSGGANKVQTTVPTEDNSLAASHIKIEPGTTHEYTLVVTFLRTDEDQSANMNKTFSSQISITGASSKTLLSSMFYENTLGYAILNNNTPTSESGIDYSVAPTNGLYYTNNSIDGSTVYFYRGDTTLKNNVYFAGMCFKIIRTTEDGGVRLVYVADSADGKCNKTSTATSQTAYNTSSSYNAYVGFKYGSPNSTTFDAEQQNTNNSLLLEELIEWYNSKLNDYSSYVADSYYCNNRKMISHVDNNISFTKSGFSNKNTLYSSGYNILGYNENVTPSLDCNENDRFTVNNDKGNLSLGSKAIGTLTADEVLMAGISNEYTNNSSYLHTSYSYWTMTPAYFSGNKAYTFKVDAGTLSIDEVTNTHGVRPVITLTGDTVLLSGDGSETTPYKITN